MKVIPYTTSTGIQIGCRYESPKRIDYYSNDACALQSALLTRPGSTSRAVGALRLRLNRWLSCDRT